MDYATPFWMVYGEGQRAPAHKHVTRLDAENEARRLASICPGICFYVLERVSVARKVDVAFKRFDHPNYPDDEIPF